MNALQAYIDGAEYFLGTLDELPDDAWDKPTQCDGWSVRQVAVHVANGYRFLGPQVNGETIDPELRNADTWPPDLRDAARAAFADAVSVLRTPGLMESSIMNRGRETPMSTVANIRVMDNVVHAWDVRSSLGMDATIPAELLKIADDSTPPELMAATRASGAYAAPIDVDESADFQTRVLAKLGRDAR